MPDPTDAPAPAPAPAPASDPPPAAPAPAPTPAAPAAPPAAPAPAPASSPAAAPPAAPAPAPAPGEQPPADGQKTEQPKPAPKAPEKYDLKTPDGAEAFDEGVLGVYAEEARRLDLSQEDAQALLAKVGPAIQARNMAALTSFYEDIGGLPDTWAGQMKADKEFGGDRLDENLAIAAKARDLGGPEFVKLLDKTGLGNHPAVIRTFIRLGRSLSEERLVTGGPAAGVQPSAAAVLYGSTAPKS